MAVRVANEICLFPLPVVLFPWGRTSVQVFEARYLDMVRDCLKADAGIGVILLRSGSEVYRPGQWRLPELAEIGCYGRIVDWNALPQGRLGLILEGQQRFRLLDSRQDAAHLLHGTVEWLQPEIDQALPQAFELLPPLLARLAEHPSIRQLGMVLQPESALRTANQLAKLLPVGLAEKQRLLSLDDPVERLQLIEQLLAVLEA